MGKGAVMLVGGTTTIQVNQLQVPYCKTEELELIIKNVADVKMITKCEFTMKKQHCFVLVLVTTIFDRDPTSSAYLGSLPIATSLSLFGSWNLSLPMQCKQEKEAKLNK